MSASYEPLSRLPANKPSRARELMALIALIVSILGFVLQTEVLGYVSDVGYRKPMFVMYVTHSCMMSLLPLQIVCLWALKWFQRGEGFTGFYHKHTQHLRQTAVDIAERNGYAASDVLKYMIRTVAILAVSLNFAGASWYIAVNMTTTADLTAIFNCSTFFAYGFSVVLLKEHLNLAKSISVVVSVIGVFVIAYLGGASDVGTESADGHRRSIGNLVIACGTILYGLYEVLYKKVACPPQRVSARKQAAFANFVGAAIGLGTLILMLPLLIVLHFTGIERFELPSGKVIYYLALSIVGNVSFAGAFLVLISLTSPVLGSVSSLLATCTVPLVNFVIWRQTINFGEIIGGILIIGAFALMTWASADDFVEEDEGQSVLQQ